MSTVLLNCPFCGSNARTIDNTSDDPTWAQCNNHGRKKKGDVRCVMSHTIIPIDAWNNRAVLATPPAAMPAQASESAEPVAWIVFAEYQGAMVSQFPACLEKEVAEHHAKMYGQTPTEVVPLYRAPPAPAPAIQAQLLTDAE